MRHSFRLLNSAAAVLLVGSLAACNSVPLNSPTQSAQGQYPTQNQQPSNAEYGRLSNIEMFQTQEAAKSSGVGAVLGGVTGAVVGRQIGGGTGRDIATVAGAVGGAVVGNSIEKNRAPTIRQVYRMTVQLDNGQARAYEMPSTGDLRIGDRVRVQNGQLFRY
ncbi:hypothetical protein AwPolaro_11480 [Polaromonas sp.]|nr:hypothetical protein AwPolaro_11480 [Polaromonas sp.]